MPEPTQPAIAYPSGRKVMDAVPKYETARDAKSSRKFGACSGPVLAGMRPGVALEPGVGLPERHRTLVQLDVVGGRGHLVSD